MEEQRAWSRARNKEVGAAGERWIARKSAELAGLPIGTVVIIDVETGEYVTAATAIDAMDEYDRRIGREMAGFIHQIGQVTFLGGGLGQG